MQARHRGKVAAVLLAGAAFLSLSPAGIAAGSSSDSLLQGFRSPPQAARPRVWWHWMNGNVSKDGIRKDLDWMHRMGIGGANAIDASLSTPQVVDKRLVYMTPEWQDAFRYAVGLADKYGLEMSIDSSPGWSETGGPWVTPQEAMKKLVWSATRVSGPFHGVLPQPPGNTGPIQNAPMVVGILDPKPKTAGLVFYRDSVVIAYRLPTAPGHIETATSSVGEFDSKSLSDGDLTNGPTLTPTVGEKQVWVELTYDKPTQIQAITVAAEAAGAPGADAALEASDDKKVWRKIIDVSAGKLPQRTLSFAPVTARFFRVTFSPASPPPLEGIFTNRASGVAVNGLLSMLAGPKQPLSYKIHELILHTAATVNDAEAKADFSIVPDYYALATPDAVPGTSVNASDVVVLTDRMKPDGSLDWTPPPGDWVVLRMGYAPLGTENHPAPTEATGLEVDKLNRDHVQAYMQHYLDTYEKVTGPELFGKRGLNAFTVDSTEVGMQNWTESMVSDFQRLRGYDPTPWLPALTGVVIGSAEQTDKFLWDFRRTIDELVAHNHYGTIADIVKKDGLVHYAEALEDHRPTFGDDMEMRQYASIPMGAMWTYGKRRESYPTYVADLRGAASIAHIYGQNLVAAESLTSALQPWNYAPRGLKPIVDLEFALGVNRVVVHESAHQPVDKPPGLSLFVFGQFFNRLENWAEYAAPWVSYMARCSYLLQQGHYAADIAYFYGEEAPLTGLFGEKDIDAPQGYGFDFVNSDVLLHQTAVDHGALTTQSGMRYRVLYLGGSSRYMTLPTLRRIRDLVAQGVVLVGDRPIGSPSLADKLDAFKSVADDLFGGAADHAYGKGRVISGGSLDAALATLKLSPDFEYTKPESDTELMEIHRKIGKGDLYFVTNRLDRSEHLTATFRVSGMSPEIWNAVTGKVTPADYRIVGGHTEVPLDLGPYDSAFVVFRKPAASSSRTTPKPVETTLAALTGPWTISFQPGRGAPGSITENDLQSWSDNTDPGVRYFSGTGTYTKDFVAGPAKHGDRVVLDLGELREVAEVRVNGKSVGTLWNPPFRLDVTDAIHPGKNTLEVKVANLWVNRLIGDQQPDAKAKYTFTTIPTYDADAPLRTSGLLGPVKVLDVRP